MPSPAIDDNAYEKVLMTKKYMKEVLKQNASNGDAIRYLFDY